MVDSQLAVEDPTPAADKPGMKPATPAAKPSAVPNRAAEKRPPPSPGSPDEEADGTKKREK